MARQARAAGGCMLGCGVVFKLSPGGTVTVLLFLGLDGRSGLIADRAGNLYGTTPIGGVASTLGCSVYGCGTIASRRLCSRWRRWFPRRRLPLLSGSPQPFVAGKQKPQEGRGRLQSTRAAPPCPAGGRPDGALGFWQAVEEVWPRTRGQSATEQCAPKDASRTRPRSP